METLEKNFLTWYTVNTTQNRITYLQSAQYWHCVSLFTLQKRFCVVTNLGDTMQCVPDFRWRTFLLAKDRLPKMLPSLNRLQNNGMYGIIQTASQLNTVLTATTASVYPFFRVNRNVERQTNGILECGRPFGAPLFLFTGGNTNAQMSQLRHGI